MIVRISGILVQLDGETAVLDREGVCYEVLVPTYVADGLNGRLGQTVTFHTIQYYEGTAVGGNLFPRLVGFLEGTDRAFFLAFTKVRGMGYRKALRALAKPPGWIAEAIERGDTKMLATLPELGKRTAEQVVATLKGKLEKFAATVADEPADALTRSQREALEILLQLGERRGEAVELVRKVAADQGATDPAKMVEAVYRLKSGVI
ncbi:MAG: Holliday junction branch migration protein RuvA [Phycisphaerae bacterium]